MLTSKNITVKDTIPPDTTVTAAFKGKPADEEIDYLGDHFIFKENQYIKDPLKWCSKNRY
jgi:hypothetical protein